MSRVDHRRCGDSDHRIDERAVNLASRNCSNALCRIRKMRFPKRARLLAGIECIDTVIFGGDENYIVLPRSNRNSRQIQRLCVYVAIDLEGKELPETARIYVGGRERGFMQVRPSASVVVLRSSELRLCRKSCGDSSH